MKVRRETDGGNLRFRSCAQRSPVVLVVPPGALFITSKEGRKMAKKTPQEVAKKWAERLQAAKPQIESGVRSVTVAPTQKAAAKADKYVAGVQRAVEENRFQRGLQKVSLADWQQSMIVKGLQRLSNGVKAAEGKVEQFQAEFLPYVESVQARVNAMPNDTEEQRDQKMLENARMLRQFKRK